MCSFFSGGIEAGLWLARDEEATGPAAKRRRRRDIPAGRPGERRGCSVWSLPNKANPHGYRLVTNGYPVTSCPSWIKTPRQSPLWILVNSLPSCTLDIPTCRLRKQRKKTTRISFVGCLVLGGCFFSFRIHSPDDGNRSFIRAKDFSPRRLVGMSAWVGPADAAGAAAAAEATGLRTPAMKTKALGLPCVAVPTCHLYIDSGVYARMGRNRTLSVEPASPYCFLGALRDCVRLSFYFCSFLFLFRFTGSRTRWRGAAVMDVRKPKPFNWNSLASPETEEPCWLKNMKTQRNVEGRGGGRNRGPSKEVILRASFGRRLLLEGFLPGRRIKPCKCPSNQGRWKQSPR